MHKYIEAANNSHSPKLCKYQGNFLKWILNRKSNINF